MITDFHTHTFPARIAAGAIANMQRACHSRAFSSGTPEGLAASMAGAGIARSVVLPVATNPAKLSSINDLSIAMNGRGGLVYFGCTHPAAPDWRRELERIAEAGIRGIKLHPMYQDADIDDPRYVEIMRRAGELGLIVVMHSGRDIGFPGVVRCSPEMVRRALSGAGEVSVVLAHMGGWRDWEEAHILAGDERVYIDTALSLGEIAPLDDGYYAPEDLPLMAEERFMELVRRFGSGRVLFGTDSPWADQAAELRKMRALPLAEEELRDVLEGNAAALLGDIYPRLTKAHTPQGGGIGPFLRCRPSQ